MFRLPDHTQRQVVVGRTGSGKTQFGGWLLSEAPFDRMPYVIIDYKGDELLNSIPWVEEIGYGTKLSNSARGLHIIHPMIDDTEDMDAFLKQIWARENCGLFIDEAYMMPNIRGPSGLRAILTQGRSKHIPLISLSQRPVDVTRFFFSEADFFSVFQLNHKKDRQTIGEYIPNNTELKLPGYWSHHYDVGKDASNVLKPAPDRDTILNRFDMRLKPRRRAI